MKGFSAYVQEACLAGHKPRLICAPADDEKILALLETFRCMVRPVLIGNRDEIQAILSRVGLVPRDDEVVHEPDRERSCEKALDMALKDPAAILMESGRGRPLQEFLRKGRQRGTFISSACHITCVDDPHRERSFMVADTLMHTQPDLKDKTTILTAALSMVRKLGLFFPRVAVLAALEYVNPSIPSTVDAAVLSKMAQRNQFGDALVEGPLDIDCALSREACSRKKIASILEGDADIFLVPDVHSGQCFLQFLSFFGQMQLCGFIAGLPVPVIVPMPYDTASGRIAAVAISCMLSGAEVSNG